MHTCNCFGPYQYKGCLVSFLLLTCFTEIPKFNANNADPDRSVASDLGLHCCQHTLNGTLCINRLMSFLYPPCREVLSDWKTV